MTNRRGSLTPQNYSLNFNFFNNFVWILWVTHFYINNKIVSQTIK